jgi:hypothetical protein
MINLRCASILLAMLVLAACDGGAFVPLAGPMYGNFEVDELAIGAFNFTTGDRLLGGTGTLIHNSQTVAVSISANINGTTITGTVANASLGGGEFLGHFVGSGAAEGTFSYTDVGAISTTSGTWRAEID